MDDKRIIILAAGEIKHHREADNTQSLLNELKSCSMSRDLQRGRRIHAKAVESRKDSNLYVVTALLKMYAKCCSMGEARSVFDGIPKSDVVSWTALLMGYAENEEGHLALVLFSRMKLLGCVPDSVTYVSALKACTSLVVNERGSEKMKVDCLERGRKIHSEIGCHLDHYVQSTLIDMYAKCGSMVDAHLVFDSIQKPNVVSWTALLLGYAENGEGQVGLELFIVMKARGCVPNSVTYVAALKACTSLRDGSGKLERARQLHSEIGCHLEHQVQSMLIDTYAKCGSMVDARRVFDGIQKPDMVSWTSLLLGYAEHGNGLVALALLSEMKAGGCVPNSVTYMAALKACIALAVNGRKSEFLDRGRAIHSEIGFHLNQSLQNTLVDMYAKCGSVVEARFMFDSIKNPNMVSWNALLLGYAENGEGFSALELFSRMKALGYVPDCVTYIAALKACTSLAVNGDGSRKPNCLKWGREIHSEIGCHVNHFLQNTLIDMYRKCGSILDTHRMFDSIQKPDVVSWTSLLLGYVDHEDGLAVLELFARMKGSGCVPNSLTYIAALKGCCLTGALALGRKFHSEISEFTPHLVTCLVDFYAKCGSLVEARTVFDLYSRARDVSAWNALLAGYSSFGDSTSVFEVFETMQGQGFRPDAVTFVHMLLCCSHVGLLEKAREYFKKMPLHYGVTPDCMHYTCMVDILGRANHLHEAVAVLRNMPCNLDAVTWMTLLAACCKWNNVELGRLAFKSLVDMEENHASAYVQMAHIYGSSGMWEEQKRALEMRMKFLRMEFLSGQLVLE